MTRDQLDGLVAWAASALHREDPEAYPLTGAQVEARLAGLALAPGIDLADNPEPASDPQEYTAR